MLPIAHQIREQILEYQRVSASRSHLLDSPPREKDVSLLQQGSRLHLRERARKDVRGSRFFQVWDGPTRLGRRGQNHDPES